MKKKNKLTFHIYFLIEEKRNFNTDKVPLNDKIS